MTLDEAIKHAEEVADKKEREKQKWERWLENDSDYRAVNEKVSCELCAEEHRQLAEWLKELKQLRERTRWIPVSEKLPEEKVEVLATTEWESITIAERYSANDYFINEGATNADEDDIIAWMPLPEPYTVEGSDKE